MGLGLGLGMGLGMGLGLGMGMSMSMGMDAVKVEGARTLHDVARRTNLAYGPCGGSECALAAAVIVGDELGWSASEVRAQAADLLRARRRSRPSGRAPTPSAVRPSCRTSLLSRRAALAPTARCASSATSLARPWATRREIRPRRRAAS